MGEVALTKKDIIAINQQFSDGFFENESSLDYALSNQKRNIPWTKKMAYLIRAILVDHTFSDGNKRTACFILIYFVESNDYRIEQKKALNIIKRIVLKNIASINKIRDMIEDAIAKED